MDVVETQALLAILVVVGAAGVSFVIACILTCIRQAPLRDEMRRNQLDAYRRLTPSPSRKSEGN